MSENLILVDATIDESEVVGDFITQLLLELSPESTDEVLAMNINKIAQGLLRSSSILAILAKIGKDFVGVVTMHQCAAVYAGGYFGEISELYVSPQYRKHGVGKCLVEAAMEKCDARGWKRLEVCSPPVTVTSVGEFYVEMGFTNIGNRFRCLIGN